MAASSKKTLLTDNKLHNVAVARLKFFKEKGVINRHVPGQSAARALESYILGVWGGKVDTSFDEGFNVCYAHARDFMFRISPDVIQVGVKATFDRWGNSVDFEIRPVPRDDFGREALLLALNDAVTAKQHIRDDGVESPDIYPKIKALRKILQTRVSQS